MTFAMYCTDSWESCDMENQKSIGDFCGELQRVFFFKVPKMEFFIKLIFEFFTKGGYFFYKKCAFS